MLAALLVADGRSVVVADHRPERREQAAELGARGVSNLDRHELVFEAVGRPEAWRAAVEASAPGGVVVLVGGCPPRATVDFDPGPIHYDELELRGAFHHSPAEVDQALELISTFDWRALLGDTIPLEQLPRALAAPADGRAVKWVVDPRA
jgi:L-iditol 2-dehydrogenase